MNKILCSTGAFGSKPYPDADGIIELAAQIHADGFELMITSNWGESAKEWSRKLREYNVNFPIGHLSKSDIVKHYESGDRELTKQGHQKLKSDCQVLSYLNIHKAVMHLWGWPDQHFENVLIALKEAVVISAAYGVELLIETLPCRNETILRRLKQVVEAYPGCRFTADVRLLRYCNMQDHIFTADWIWKENRIGHIHISDCGVDGKGNVMVTPTLQPGEGIIDFGAFFNGLKAHNYTETITLESSGFDPERGIVKVDKLNNSLEFIREMIK